MTTVGYGDLSPQTGEGRVVAVILMFFGIGLISALTANVASFMMRERGKDKYSRNAIEHICNRLKQFDDLSEKELGEIHAVLVALKREKIKENQENVEVHRRDNV